MIANHCADQYANYFSFLDFLNIHVPLHYQLLSLFKLSYFTSVLWRAEIDVAELGRVRSDEPL